MVIRGCQIQFAMFQPPSNKKLTVRKIQTKQWKNSENIENGKYTDAIDLVCNDFLARNVGTHHVAYQIRPDLQNLVGIDVDRLPKALLVKLMALEADILAKKEVAVGKKTVHCIWMWQQQQQTETFLECTNYYSYSAGLKEAIEGDTQTQIEVTKHLFNELASHLQEEKEAEQKTLLNIQNTVSDRGPTSQVCDPRTT